MLRRLFTLLSGLSLVLCVGTVSLWARGAYEFVNGTYIRSPRQDASVEVSFTASSYSGTLLFELTRQDFGPVYLRGLTPLEMQQFHAWYPVGMRWYAAGRDQTILLNVPNTGFQAMHYADTSRPGRRYDNWVLGVRAWMAMALLLLMPAVWVKRFCKSRRARRHGLCPACGYDLRATPERCPECGRVPTGAKD
jgi:hypothetical protein